MAVFIAIIIFEVVIVIMAGMGSVQHEKAKDKLLAELAKEGIETYVGDFIVQTT